MPATTAASKFARFNGNDLDTGLAQQRVGVGITVITDDNSGLDGYHIVAIIPLFP